VIKIVCHACGKPLHLDETKLPMKEVKFPCPQCKTMLSFNRQTFQGEVPRIPSQDSIFASAPEVDILHRSTAFIVGGDVPGLNEEMRALGFTVQRYAGAQEAREQYYVEYPQLVLFIPAQMSMPPLPEMLPLTQIIPKDRRRSFFILAADGLKTLDGNAAFLYQVDMVIALKDIGSLHRAYREALQFRQGLYRHFRNFHDTEE